jgi:hypothetical protein
MLSRKATSLPFPIDQSRWPNPRRALARIPYTPVEMLDAVETDPAPEKHAVLGVDSPSSEPLGEL